jgi:hypothetical protein
MKPARYAVTLGLSGCYMPDTYFGAFEVTRRRDLAQAIRDYVRMSDMPASLMRDIKITRLWSFIKQHGSSTAHFRLVHKGYELAFHGLTEDEYNEE